MSTRVEQALAKKQTQLNEKRDLARARQKQSEDLRAKQDQFFEHKREQLGKKVIEKQDRAVSARIRSLDKNAGKASTRAKGISYRSMDKKIQIQEGATPAVIQPTSAPRLTRDGFEKQVSH